MAAHFSDPVGLADVQWSSLDELTGSLNKGTRSWRIAVGVITALTLLSAAYAACAVTSMIRRVSHSPDHAALVVVENQLAESRKLNQSLADDLRAESGVANFYIDGYNRVVHERDELRRTLDEHFDWYPTPLPPDPETGDHSLIDPSTLPKDKRLP